MAKRTQEVANHIMEAAFNLEQSKAIRRMQSAIDEQRRHIAALTLENDRHEREREILLGLSDRTNIRNWSKPPTRKRGQATAIAISSDWHVEEVVTPEKVNHLNEHNPKIAERRIATYAARTARMIDRYRKDAIIDEGVLILGGDMISGFLHADQVETNAMSPIRACEFAEELCEGAIRYLLRESGCKRWSVVCLTGNHDRTTDKLRCATRNDNSYLTLIYSHLRKRMAGIRNLEWQIADGEFAYFDVYNRKVRALHGDAIKYQGGLAGLAAPANRMIADWNRTIRADYTIFGHHHRFNWNDANGWICNGSTMGTNCYGLKFGAAPPCQALAIIDEHRGLTDVCKIYVE